MAENNAPAPLTDAQVEQRRLQAKQKIVEKAKSLEPGLARRLAQMKMSDTYRGGASGQRALDPAHQDPSEQLVFFASFYDRDVDHPDAQIYAYLNLHPTEEWRVFDVIAGAAHAYQDQPGGAGTNSVLGLPTSGRAAAADHPEWLWFQMFEGGILAELKAKPSFVQRYHLDGTAWGEPYEDKSPVDLSNKLRTVLRGDLVPNQYDPAAYRKADGTLHDTNFDVRNSTCGAAAIYAFEKAAGMSPMLGDIVDRAVAHHAYSYGVSWNGPDAWIAFAQSEGLSVAGIGSALTADVVHQIEDAVQARRMVAISTVRHYWVIEGYNADTQLYYCGNSGLNAPNGAASYFSLASIASQGEGIQRVIVGA